MGVGTLSLLLFGGVVGLLVAGVPFAFAAGAVAVVAALLMFGSDAMFLISSRTFEMANSFSLVAVPMFVLMASVLERSGIARDLYAVMHRAVARVHGGVGIATVFIALVLGATTGIIGGEIVLLGLVALPQMLRLGYDRKLAMGLVCAGGSLGTMMPPSIVLIFYGIMTNTSIGDLFLASATPACLLAGLYIAYIYLRARLDPRIAPPDIEGKSQVEAPTGWRAWRDVGLPLLVAASVLGSIYLGIASITESAACGVAGVLFATWVRGEFSLKLLDAAVKQTFLTCGVVMWLVFGTNALVGVYNAIGGIAFAQQLLGGLATSPASFIALAMAVFLVLGFFFDWIAILFLTMPIFGPMLGRYGVDPIWFGILFNMCMQIAYLTPPMGPACFYLKSVAPPEISLQQIFAAMWPFIGLQVIGLILVILFPTIALWLPRAIG